MYGDKWFVYLRGSGQCLLFFTALFPLSLPSAQPACVCAVYPPGDGNRQDPSLSARRSRLCHAPAEGEPRRLCRDTADLLMSQGV